MNGLAPLGGLKKKRTHCVEEGEAETMLADIEVQIAQQFNMFIKIKNSINSLIKFLYS